MTAYHCTKCALDFDADEARCPQCLRVSSVRERGGLAPPPDAPPHDPGVGARHVNVNAMLQAALCPLSVVSLASSVINFALSTHAGELGALGGLYGGDAPGEREGQLATYACIGVWALLGVVWTPLNAWGLWKKKRWARVSTLVYWAGSLVTCCCIPIGVYGLWSLSRREVRDVLTG